MHSALLHPLLSSLALSYCFELFLLLSPEGNLTLREILYHFSRCDTEYNNINISCTKSNSDLVVFYVSIVTKTIFEPTCVYAQWALMHHFMYVCLDVT